MAEWVPATDDLGRTYYYDPETLRVTWNPPDDRAAGVETNRAAEGVASMLREAQEEIRDHTRIHLASKVRTCLRIGLDHAVREAFRLWRRAPSVVATRAFVLPMSRAMSAWMIQRDRAVAATASTMLLQDYVDLLKLRVEALESAERAQAEFERLAHSARSISHSHLPRNPETTLRMAKPSGRTQSVLSTVKKHTSRKLI